MSETQALHEKDESNQETKQKEGCYLVKKVMMVGTSNYLVVRKVVRVVTLHFK